jgi:membrane-bound lytic murein transglycosylase A
VQAIPDELAKAASLLQPAAFDALPGFSGANFCSAWRAFYRSSIVISERRQSLRPGIPIPEAWLDFFKAVASATAPSGNAEAESFFRRYFAPYRVCCPEKAFYTGYYEPEVYGARRPTPEFSEPIFDRPHDLETFVQGSFPLGEPLAAGRRLPDGSLAPFLTRKQIDGGELQSAHPILWVRDGAEAFKIHVQGSARVRMPNGSIVRLTYAGRNGHPYSSLGKLLIQSGQISGSRISPEAIYQWIRAKGQRAGEPGRTLMQKNASYIFFHLNKEISEAEGPIGAASVSLTPLRSLAIDRQFWPYGLPYWIAGDWLAPNGDRFCEMLIGQDTGSAILGIARADIFFGSGEEAARLAGGVCHSGEMFVLLPRLSASGG